MTKEQALFINMAASYIQIEGFFKEARAQMFKYSVESKNKKEKEQISAIYESFYWNIYPIMEAAFHSNLALKDYFGNEDE